MTGLHLSQYRIDSELGRGGMGIVYRATDTKLNRTVALKVLPAAALSSDDDRARFVREAQSAAQLHHPNIATVFGIDEAVPVEPGTTPQPGTESRLFIAMEFIEGETLSDLVKKGPLKLQDAVNVAGQVAEALKEAHAKQIVHRDIKSANVMLTQAGVAKVLDFGLAKTNQSTMLTRMGSTLGTVAYMSPEQARGHEVDGRTDLYSLGTMLYEMVAGRLPFGGDYEQAVLYGILNEPPEPLTAVRTGVPMELERITAKLLSKEAEYRYQTAADLLADLKALDISGSGITRRSMPAMSAAQIPAVSGPAVKLPVWAYGAIVGALAVGALGSWTATRQPEPSPPPTRTVPLAIEEVASARVMDVSPDGDLIAVKTQGAMGEWRVVLYDTGTGEWTKPINLGATDILEFSPNGEWLLASNIDLNGPMVRYRLSDDRSQTIPLRGAAATWLNAEEILYTPGDLGLWRAGVDGQNARKVASADSIPPLDVVWYAQPLPGERQVVATLGAFGGVALGIVDLESGELQRLADDVCCARYLPSGHLLYTQQPISNGTFMLRPFDTARAEFSGVEVPTGISSNPFSEVGMGADGTLAYALTTASRSDFVYYWIGTDGRLMDEQDEFSVGPMILPYGGGTSSDWGRSGIEHVELSHGGDRFVAARFADGEYRVFVNDLSRRSSQRVSFDGPSGWPTWSPDDHWIYYVGRRGGKDVILRRRADLSAAEEVVLVGKGTLADPEITPDGKRLLYYTTDDEVGHIVDLADTTRQEVFSETGAFDPMVSPDGRYVAFESQGLDVRDLDGTALYQVAPEFGDAWDPSWSADGNYLYYRDVGTLYRVPVETTPVFSQGPREVVATVGGNFHYSLHPDGERILIQGSMLSQANVSSTIQVWFNWFTTARRLAPESE